MKKIGVLTSGADAPGMNAHIRSIVRTASARGVQVIGIRRGFSGLIESDFFPLERKDTANIIGLGGTILRTSQSEEFMLADFRAKAADNLKAAGIEGIIGCGGEGTMKGLHALHRDHNVKVIGTPGTIDNDMYGTDFTIGFDTAINTAAEAIDRIRDTADSQGRVYIIEVMGSEAGFVATMVGIACGAEYMAIPETLTNIPDLYKRITREGKHKRYIVVIGEGDEVGGAVDLAALLKECYNIDSRVAVLGHIQRGGKPTVADRVLGSRLGQGAVETLLGGASNVMVGEVHGQLQFTSLPQTYERKKALQDHLIRLAELLA